MRALKYDLFIWFFLILFGMSLGYRPSIKEAPDTPHATVSDTTLSGMHYIIYTEPRTGDLVVVNSTIDSLRVQMFSKQIK
ncbi:hypothetical protein JZU46_06800 [bacterium]|jgi:hypothetical protein|nr:hypothetical protein [bacterium]